jgi:hypothetical protein
MQASDAGMTCIFTGAYLHLPEYGAYIPADVHAVGDALVFTLNDWAFATYGAPLRSVTHEVTTARGLFDQRRAVIVVTREWVRFAD